MIFNEVLIESRGSSGQYTPPTHPPLTPGHVVIECLELSFELHVLMPVVIYRIPITTTHLVAVRSAAY